MPFHAQLLAPFRMKLFTLLFAGAVCEVLTGTNATLLVFNNDPLQVLAAAALWHAMATEKPLPGQDQ